MINFNLSLQIVVDGLICAGKKIHEVLIQADNVGAENLAVKYVQECQIMADLRHPHVVLFLECVSLMIAHSQF